MRLLLFCSLALLPVIGLLRSGAQSEIDQAIREFKQAYVKAGQDSSARAAAVRSLGRYPHSRTLQVLAQVLAGDGSGQETAEVRIAAADTIGSFFQKIPGAWSVPAAVARTRDRKITDVRTAAAKAVASLGQREGLRTLQDLSDDKPFEVAREAILGLGKIPDRSSVPFLIKLLREVERVPEVIAPEIPFHGVGVAGGAIIDDARAEQNQRRTMLLDPVLGTLRRLTEQNFQSYKEYSKWWATAAPTFKVSGSK
jgi:HEAT repeat protein